MGGAGCRALLECRTTRRRRPGTGLPFDDRDIFGHGHPWIRHVGQREQAEAAATPARLSDLAPDTVLLETETKLITHAIRMAAYNTETALAGALHGHYTRADDEAHALVREALTGSGDIQPADGVLYVRLEPLSAPRRTAALTALCDQLNATHTRYPGTTLVLHYQVKPDT